MIEWFIPLVLLFVTQVVARIDSLILGYGLFRVASDVEKLPFPMAPIKAAGILALSENTTQKEGWRWRCFSISAALGMVFGLIYVAVPTISGAFLSKPFQILPIPWLDTSVQTQEILPATATGISFDLANFFAGMAFPFYAVVGGFVGLIVTFVFNPWLYNQGILKTWEEGTSTVEIMFANNVDFYLSFGIGLSLAVAVIGLWQTFAGMADRKGKQQLDKGVDSTPIVKGIARGDIRTRSLS